MHNSGNTNLTTIRFSSFKNESTYCTQTKIILVLTRSIMGKLLVTFFAICSGK